MVNYDETIKLFQNKPNIIKNNDVIKFEASLLYKNENCGNLFGETTFVKSLNINTQARVRKLYFNLCCGTIISEGFSNTYNKNGLLTDSHETIITGGTEKFEGITGKIITTRLNNNNNEHEHVLYFNYN